MNFFSSKVRKHKQILECYRHAKAHKIWTYLTIILIILWRRWCSSLLIRIHWLAWNIYLYMCIDLLFISFFFSILIIYISVKLIYTGVWLMHCHLDVHLPWGLGTAFVVENGPTLSSTLPPPPPDLPHC